MSIVFNPIKNALGERYSIGFSGVEFRIMECKRRLYDGERPQSIELIGSNLWMTTLRWMESSIEPTRIQDSGGIA